MPNHFHLVLETPQPNLVSGMKWFLGTLAVAKDISRRSGDYLHLNPVRAKMPSDEGLLADHGWSSYPAYLQEPKDRPSWLRADRLLLRGTNL